MSQLSPEVRKLLEEPNFAAMATLMTDGSPQVTTVWVDTDGEDVLINVADDRRKIKNLERDPRVALSLTDRDDPYRQVLIRGRVVQITASGGAEHVDKLAWKYRRLKTYDKHRPGVQRLIVRVRPERVIEDL